MKWVWDDGGRAAAGFRGLAGDCVCRAIAIASGQDYRVVYNAINKYAQGGYPLRRRGLRSSARTGVAKPVYRRYLSDLGWEWVPTMFVGQGCRVHLRTGELPGGRLVVNCSRHLTAVIDGVVHDIFDPSRDGTRCVYGFWQAQSATRQEPGCDRW
jgi:hypothetical protein